MVDLVYGTSTFERKRGDFPPLPVINMFAENIPSEPGVTLQSRPGLTTSGSALGTGPIKGIYKADGVLSNSQFVISASTIYKDGVSLGTITGTGPASFAGYENDVFFNVGGEIKTYNGTTLSSIAFPDSANVAKIAVGASRLLAIRKDTGKLYWSGVLGVTVGALNFATAESQPDRLLDILYLGDRAILFGAETVEFWPNTSDSTLPFAPLIGQVYSVGVKDTGCACHFNRGFAWITNYNEICVNDPENIVSEPELQVRIKNSTTRSLWTFYVDDNEYLAVRLDGETWAYGARSQVWSKLESYGGANFLPQCFDANVFGSSTDGRLLAWNDSSHVDLDGPMLRTFSAWLPLTGDFVTVNNIILRTNPGTTPNLTGEYLEPKVELQTSRDGGNTWQPWKSRSLGQQGKYLRKVYWSSLGQFGYPGLLVRIRATDPVPFRVSGLAMNEPFGGR